MAPGGSEGRAATLGQAGEEAKRGGPARGFGPELCCALQRQPEIEHILEFLAAKEAHWTGPGKRLRVAIGLARANNDGMGGGDQLAIHISGLDVPGIDDRFPPTAGFENHDATGVDGAHAEAEIGFLRQGGFHADFLLQGIEGNGLVDLLGAKAMSPLERIGRVGKFLFAAPGLPTGEDHGGSETGALSMADGSAAGPPSDQGRAVKRTPAGDTEGHKLPEFDPGKDGSRNASFHRNSKCLWLQI